MNRIHLSSKLFSKNLKSIPYTDWCFENKDIIKLIIKTKNLKVHTRLRLKKIFNTKLFFSTYLSN